MNLFKLCFSCWLRCVLIALPLAMSSCAAKNKIADSESAHGDAQSFFWRVEIMIQPHNIDAYSVLAVFGNASKPILFKPANDLPQGVGQGIIVVYITATDNQVQKLRESLFEAGAIGLIINKVNHD